MTLPVVFTANGAQGYNLTKSLRFRSSASAYLNRTPASTTNQRTFTWSGWVKLGQLGTYQGIFGANQGNGYGTTQKISSLNINNTNTLRWTEYYSADGISTNWSYSVETTPVYRDPSAWYHIVVAVDYTQATASNRVKLYVNESQVTALATANYPPQNFDSWLNTTSTQHQIGYYGVNPYYYFDGYMAEINFIDGQALTPSSFGQTNSATGVWQPAKYTGTYGTNGFYLPFTNTTSTSTLGNDFSGNSNTWTVNNISLTSGSTYDSMTDVPTLTSATTANYAVLNPLSYLGSNTATNGNLTANLAVSYGAYGIRGTMAIVSSMKSYFEVNVTSANTWASFGILDIAYALGGSNYAFSTGSNCILYYRVSGQKIVNGTTSAYSGNTFTNGDVIGVAVDYVNNTCTFYVNNVSQGSINLPSTSVNYVPVVLDVNNQNATYDINFGQRPFAYTPPTGFKALNTFNLPTPTIGATASTTASNYMAATTFNGIIGGTQTITNTVNGTSFQPDLVWMKLRSGVQDHFLVDSVRGSSNILVSNSTAAEITGATTFVTSLNSNGWSLGSGGYGNGTTVIGWQWRASNAAGVTNTAGSITSTVSANTTARFSIVTFTNQTSGTATVGHGLGVAPKFVIVKGRNYVSGWNCYHSGLTSANYYIALDGTGAQVSNNTFWNNTDPTSTVFSLGSAWAGSSITSVAYCFAQVAGYSAFGSYTGNGSTDGPFVFTGFRPRFVFVKNASSTGSWIEFDSSTNPYNEAGNLINLNTSGAEFTTSDIKFDILSNGFKVRQVNSAVNGSGNTLIYAAFAENPFKYSLAR